MPRGLDQGHCCWPRAFASEINGIIYISIYRRRERLFMCVCVYLWARSSKRQFVLLVTYVYISNFYTHNITRLKRATYFVSIVIFMIIIEIIIIILNGNYKVLIFR